MQQLSLDSFLQRFCLANMPFHHSLIRRYLRISWLGPDCMCVDWVLPAASSVYSESLGSLLYYPPARYQIEQCSNLLITGTFLPDV
jgi:hypothetical protein